MKITKILVLLVLLVSTIFPYTSQMKTVKAETQTPKKELLFIYETEGLLTPEEKEIFNQTNDMPEDQKVLKSWNITKLTMKQFNSYREELDGKFDAIYIAKGNYSPRLIPEDPTSNNDTRNRNDNFRQPYHNVPELNNDMTPYNVSLIENNFIEKGLPVFIHSSVTKQYDYEIPIDKYPVNIVKDEKGRIGAHVMPDDRKHVLKNFYEKYNKLDLSNVYLIDGLEEGTGKKIASAKIKDELEKLEPSRPSISNVSNNGSTMNSRLEYKKESKEKSVLEVYFQVDSFGKGNTADDILVNLYFDDNYDNYFASKEDNSDSFEHVYTTSLASLSKSVDGKYTLAYEIPRGISSIRDYKVELVANNHSSYATGKFYYKDHRAEVKVLQIVPSTNESNSYLRNIIKQSSVGDSVKVNTDKGVLTISDNTKINNVANDMFEIVIESSTMDYLNNKEKLGDFLANYNMLIFGFKDTYGWNSVPSDKTMGEILNFLNTGQSVFLTHDTLIRENADNNKYKDPNNWFTTKFLEKSGQYLKSANVKSYPNTNPKFPKDFYENHIGFEGSVQTTKAKKVNTGIIVGYPFVLKDTIDIDTTHSQYLGVDLSSPDVIPWYNLSSNSIDSSDSSNFYYIYSKANLTYTGAGHILGNFSADEQKLFINTMYRSFIGANHKPEVEIYKPLQTEQVPSNQKIQLVGNVFDFNAQDKELKVQISIKNADGSVDVVVPYETYQNGEDFIKYIDHNRPGGGKVTLIIDAKDPRGATSSVEWDVEIKHVPTPITGTRDYTASVQTSSGIIKVGSEITLNYTMTPQDIAAEKVDTKASKLRPFYITLSDLETIKDTNNNYYLTKDNLINLRLLNRKNNYETLIINGLDKDVMLSELNSTANIFETGETKNITKEYIQEKLRGKTFNVAVIDNENNETFVGFAKLKYDNKKLKYVEEDIPESALSNVELGPIQFTEEFSDAFEVITVPNNAMKNGNKVSYEIPKISYKLNDKKTIWEAEDIQFTLKLKVVKNNQQTLPKEKSIFTYIDRQNKKQIGHFADLTMIARYGIDGIQLLNSKDESVNKFELDTTSQSALVKAKVRINEIEEISKVLVKEPTWEISNDYFTVNKQAGNLSSYIIPIQKGKGKTIKVSVTDIFGTTKTAEKEVVVYELGEIGAENSVEVYVGETKEVFRVIKGDFGDEIKYDFGLSEALVAEKDSNPNVIKIGDYSLASFTQKAKSLEVTGISPTINHFEEDIHEISVKPTVLRKKDDKYGFVTIEPSTIDIIVKKHYLKGISFNKQVLQVPTSKINTTINVFDNEKLNLILESTRKSNDETYRNKVAFSVEGAFGQEIVTVSADGTLTFKKKGYAKVTAVAEEDLDLDGKIDDREKYTTSVIIYIGDEVIDENALKNNRW